MYVCIYIDRYSYIYISYIYINNHLLLGAHGTGASLDQASHRPEELERLVVGRRDGHL